MIVHKNVLNSFLVNNHRLGRVDINPPSLIFNNNNMALQVWLPLNKSGADKNQGLANINIVNNARYEVSGKLGGCYKNGTINSGWGKDYNACLGLSASCWINIPTVEGNAIILGSVHNYPANTRFYVGCYNGYFSGGFGNTTWGDAASNRKIESGTWYHLCMTTFGTNWKLYINGQCVQEKTSSENPVILYGNIYIGEKQALYNDFRIYDHCLSPKEVKEISKGLILHYPLNDAACSKNLASNTDWERTSGNEYMQILSTYQDAGIGEYTFSCEMKVAAGTPSVNIYYDDGGYIRKYNYSVSDIYTNGVSNGKLSQQWQKVVCKLTFSTETADSTVMPHISTYYRYGSGAIISVRNPKLEKGWNPNPIYTNSSYNTVYDCSGYQNNGTINGSLSCSADSPRYNKSCKFGSGIIGATSGFASAQSYTFWANVVDKTTQIVFVDGASKLGFGISSGYFLCSTTGGTSTAYSIANLTIGWHHFAVVNDLLYIDGVLQENRSDVSYWLYSGSMLEIGNRSNGTSYPWKGQISDFRVYVTALSEEDIKELYNTSCIINS